MPADKTLLALPITGTGWNGFSSSDTLAILYSNRSAPVLRMAVPQTSLLRNFERYDYSLNFITTSTDSEGLQPEALAHSFVALLPGWAKLLLAYSCRQSVRPGEPVNAATALEASYAPFCMWDSTDDEVILQRQNKNLSIYISILLSPPRREALQKNIILSVMVRSHNKNGRFYSRLLNQLFQTLMPAMLKRLVKRQHI